MGKRFVFPDQLRGDQSFIGNGAADQRGGIGQHLNQAEETGGGDAVEADRRQDGFQFDHAIVGGRGNGRQADRLSCLQRLAQQV